MKTVDVSLGGKELHLCYNGAAMFDLWDIFGQDTPILEHLEHTGKQGFNATCIMLHKLCEQGELVRRYQGHEAQAVPNIRELMATLNPADVLKAKEFIAEAIAAGLFMEAQLRRSETDLGLLELEQSKKAAAG